MFLGQHSAWRHSFMDESILRSDSTKLGLTTETTVSVRNSVNIFAEHSGDWQ
jgi:hypothetical protein